MKKSAKAPKKGKPDIAEFMAKVQEQLSMLERKIDVLIGRPAPLHQPNQPQRQGEVKQPAGNGGRVMHKAVCADCNKECEVPFKPREGRAVYCKECFSKRKAGGAARVNGNNMHAEIRPVPAPQAPKEEGGKKRKPQAKKQASRKPKKR